MVFPFTFSLSVPGISNPFSTSNIPSEPVPSESVRPVPASMTQVVRHDGVRERRVTGPRRRPSPVPSISPVPLNRKRGWEPSISEPSQATTITASTSGYLDTPAKYRDMASDSSTNLNRSRDNLHREIEDMAAGERLFQVNLILNGCAP